MDLKSEAKRDQSLIARYEALLTLSKAISTHRNLNDLFLTLKTELARVAQFDGIVIAQRDPHSGSIAWRLAEMRGLPIVNLPNSEDGNGEFGHVESAAGPDSVYSRGNSL